MPQFQSMHILVVEDDTDARENLQDILELHGHRVETAASAKEMFAPRDWSRLDVVVLDRLLPDATADQLLPQFRRQAPGVDVIVVTGMADLQGAIAALRQGAKDYILKPLNPDALQTSLERIADRRRLARDKERSETAFRHLVEAAECLIIILRPNGSIVYFSPFAERLTGYSLAEVRGRNYFETFMPENERPAALEEFRRIQSGHQTHGYQATNLSRDGSRRWIVWNVRLLPAYEGQPAVMAVGQDITGLREAQTRALQSERLAAIGQMMAGLAHESRNALQRSQACLEMLALKVQDRPDALDLIARIQKAQDHMHHLYEDVRGYASPIMLERRPSNLQEIWRDAWSQTEPVWQGKEAVLHECEKCRNLEASVDAFRLAQVFRNLFENALAACPPPVEITISTRQARLNGQPAIELSLRDNGPGLPPESRVKLFEPFFTTKTKGTGLGLSIARRIVEAHGGTLQAGSATPGAEFLITLPRETPA